MSGSPFLVNRNGRAFKKTKSYYLFVCTVTQSVVTRLKSTLRKKRTKDLLLVLEVCLLRYHRGKLGREKKSQQGRGSCRPSGTQPHFGKENAPPFISRPICTSRSLCPCFMAPLQDTGQCPIPTLLEHTETARGYSRVGRCPHLTIPRCKRRGEKGRRGGRGSPTL